MSATKTITVRFTPLEAIVVHETLERLSALTIGDMEESLDWDAAERDAWSSALKKLAINILDKGVK
jgi:hypothetical protein